MKKILLTLTLMSTMLSPADATVLESVDVSQVRLSEGSPFYHAQQMDIRYLLGLDPDRLLAPYLKGAGLPPKADNYTNWENTGLDGHIGGHYLSALSYMYAATGNTEVLGRLRYMLAELKRAQDHSTHGYLCGDPNGESLWLQLKNGDIRAQSFGLNGGWVPLYNIHKVYAGLRDAYLIAGERVARDMLIRLTDWMLYITADLTDEQVQQMLVSEHGGLNETFADVYAITHDERYLKLARRFSHQAILQPLLKHEDRLTGMHANTQIPKIIGFKRIADLSADAAWDDAAAWFWQNVTSQRSISIGGNSVREHFHPTTDFTSMRESEQGPETCNTYNMLRLSKMLWLSTGDSRYMDYAERALTNHILSTQDPVQGGFVYFTPMRSGHYRVYSQPQTSMWCCVGSGMENHARYAEYIYAQTADHDLCVNLFIPSTVQWGKTLVQQVNRFPEEEGTSLVMREGKPRQATLRVRMPEWTEPSKVVATLNGQPIAYDVQQGYMLFSRRWTRGDSLHLSLPMHLRTMQLPDGSPYYSFLYGPVVLAAEMGRDQQEGLFADDSRGGHIAAGPKHPLSDMPLIVEDSPQQLLSHLTRDEKAPLTFHLSATKQQTLVPFYRLHECRYMVYWQTLTAAQHQEQLALQAQREQQLMALEQRTVDLVVCGEQQPESDHFVTMKQSRAGADEAGHWRVADRGGSFGYQMKGKGHRQLSLRVVYQPDAHADMVVQADGQTIGTITTASGTQQVVELPLPEMATNQLTVSFQPGTQRRTPVVYEVRLVDR